jgi:hypothetical protein
MQVNSATLYLRLAEKAGEPAPGRTRVTKMVEPVDVNPEAFLLDVGSRPPSSRRWRSSVYRRMGEAAPAGPHPGRTLETRAKETVDNDAETLWIPLTH